MALCPTNASSVQRVRVSPRRRLFQNLLKFSEPFFPGALCNSPLVRHLVASRKRSSVCLQQHRTYTQQWVTDQARSEKAVWACHSKSNLPVMKWLKGSFFLLFCPLLLHSLVHLALFLYLSKISCYKLGWESLLRSVLPSLPAWLSLLYPVRNYKRRLFFRIFGYCSWMYLSQNISWDSPGCQYSMLSSPAHLQPCATFM